MTKFLFPILVGLFIAIMIIIALCPSIKLTNEQYDRLKALSIKWDSLATLLGVIAGTIEMPYTAETLTIFVGIGACFAEMLAKSNKEYKKAVEDEKFNEEDVEEYSDDEEEGDVDE